ncbi:hypothetical protein FACS1894217_04440 [Clostridia bacterium]|nr:hypothetical protein FACS1894217_04440 [Clostridia bacterium]
MRLTFSNEAIRDIREIRQYMSHMYLGTARRFQLELSQKAANVRKNPYMYPIYNLEPEYRRVIVDKNYIMLYKINEDTQRVRVYHVLAGQMDIINYL